MKRQSREWEKIFVNRTFDKRRIQNEELLKVNKKRQILSKRQFKNEQIIWIDISPKTLYK